MERLFELIRISLNEQDCFQSAPTRKEWDNLYVQANRQGIGAVLFASISGLPTEQRPHQELLADWVTLCSKTKEDNAHLLKVSEYATRTFSKHGFPSLIIKGPSLAKHYPDPQLRHSSDVDIWLDGKRKDIISYINSVRKPQNTLYHHCDFNVIPGTSIEVHFTPSFFANPIFNSRFQTWARNYGEKSFPRCNELSEGINIPDDNFNIPYIFCHFFRHLIDEELTLKPLLDIYIILKGSHLSKDSKAEYMRLLKSWGIDRFAAGVMYILKEKFYMNDEYLLCDTDKKHGELLLKELFRTHEDKGCLDKGKSDGNHLWRFLRREMNLLHFVRLYPREILWTPYWSIRIFLLLRKR